MNAIAEKLIGMAAGGDIHAIREIADRLDGKVTQNIAGDRDGAPIVIQLDATDSAL